MERNVGDNNIANRTIVGVEIAALAIVIIATSVYLWKYFNVDTFDTTLQVAFVASVILLISILANVIVNKRW